MEFGFGVILFIAGSVLVGLCLLAIPGPASGEVPTQTGHGHGGH